MNNAKTNFAAVGVIVALAFIGYWVVAQSAQPDTSQRELAAQVDVLANTINHMRAAARSEVRAPVLDLPEDGQKWYTVLLYRDRACTDTADRHLAAMVAATPRLQSLVAQTKLLAWDSKDPMYVKGGYQASFGGRLPAIIVQRADGKVAYKVSGPQMPADGESMADEIAAGLSDCGPGPCPPRRPNEPQQRPEPVPDIRPRSPVPNEAWLLLLLLPVAAGGIALWQSRRKEPAE